MVFTVDEGFQSAVLSQQRLDVYKRQAKFRGGSGAGDAAKAGTYNSMLGLDAVLSGNRPDLYRCHPDSYRLLYQ